MSLSEKIVIIGAGQAGAQAAASLRQEGFSGAIVLVGEENELPYQRPPLSKAYLQGALEKSRLYLRPRDFYEKQGIALRLGVRASVIDRSEKSVVLESGERIPYDKLLLATGAPPRKLAAPGCERAAYVRSIADSDLLRPALASGKPLVIVGAGYIGLEVAAVARKAGVNVTVLEMAERPLSRVAGRKLSSFFENLHRDAGVQFCFGARVEGFAGSSCIEAALLAGGESIPCASALICVGAAPSTALAEAAGLKTDNGIWVDETACTDDPAIWAAGDCTNHPSPLYGRRLRLESVPNAIDQAKAAAANMAGRRVVYDATPWFWSDQYDVKLQTAGLSEGAEETVTRGDPRTKSFSIWSLRSGRLIAVDAVNDAVAFNIGKRLIAAKARPAPKMLADPGADLKSLLS
jgi:3-phenylpropionate/trans-cinnamate dioxygenase ferredoxin reductase subunit